MWGHLCYSPNTEPRIHAWPKCSFSLLWECNLNWSVWNSLVSTNEVISHVGALHHPSKGRWGDLSDKTRWTVTLPDKILSFLLIITFLSCPVSAHKSLSYLYSFWGSSLVARWDAAWFMNRSIKPIRSSDLLNWLFIALRWLWLPRLPKVFTFL